MNDSHAPTHLDELMSALALGDADLVRVAVDAILDGGDEAALREASERTERHLFPAALDLLEETVEEQAQRVVVDGVDALLFCLPVVLDVDDSSPLPFASVRAILESRAAPGERLLLADGWVHIHDLMGLDRVGYRRLVRRFVSSAIGGAGELDLPVGAFPRYPANPADFSGGAEMIALGHAGGARGTRIAARFVLGLVVRDEGVPDSPGGLVDLATGGLEDDALETLSMDVEAAIPGVWAILEPDQPINAAVRASAMIETITVEARFDAARNMLGFQPITHYCIGDDTLHIVMTADGDRVVDAVDLRLDGLDSDLVSDVIASRSQALVQHESPVSLPKTKVETIH